MRCGQGGPTVASGYPRAHRSAQGFGLVEILVCIFLVATLTLTLITGLLTQMRASDRTSRRQGTDLALENYAEHLRSLPYQGCAAPEAHDGTFTPPPGMTATIVKVEYWHKGPRDLTNPNQDGYFADSCPVGADGPIDDGAVRLRLRVTRGDLVAETHIVKVRA